MIIATVLAVAVLIAVIFLLGFLRGWSVSSASLDELPQRSASVDIQSLRNLIDPSEAEYLKAHLPESEFQALQRARNRAALDYVRRMVSNAGLLLRIGELARHSADPQTVLAAEKLVSSALELRFRSVLAMGILHVRVWFPGFRLAPYSVIEHYEKLRDRMEALTRMQSPATASSVSSAL